MFVPLECPKARKKRDQYKFPKSLTVVLTSDEPVAVVPDLTQPHGAGRRLGGLDGEARAERSQQAGYADASTYREHSGCGWGIESGGAAGQGLNRSEAIRRLVDRTLRAALV